MIWLFWDFWVWPTNSVPHGLTCVTRSLGFTGLCLRLGLRQPRRLRFPFTIRPFWLLGSLPANVPDWHLHGQRNLNWPSWINRRLASGLSLAAVRKLHQAHGRHVLLLDALRRSSGLQAECLRRHRRPHSNVRVYAAAAPLLPGRRSRGQAGSAGRPLWG